VVLHERAQARVARSAFEPLVGAIGLSVLCREESHRRKCSGNAIPGVVARVGPRAQWNIDGSRGRGKIAPSRVVALHAGSDASLEGADL
jgi:hypothetical protein